jgi:DNA-binding PadR family transcriptional regulator
MNELVILAAMLRAPVYGYALKKIAGLTYGGREMHPNIVYPLLKKFVHNGWVHQTSTPGERGQTRKQYHITASGKRYLFAQLSTFTELDASNNGAFLLRVALFDVLSKPKQLEVLEARRLFLISRAEQLAMLAEEATPIPFGAIALDRVRSVVQDELRWIRKLGVRIDSGKMSHANERIHAGS